ncbi:MAG: hypothetical protein KAR11_02010 [Phycisphaerae bacterium]|nr:hypothetical protein [Phycisphaerae bacterium]
MLRYPAIITVLFGVLLSLALPAAAQKIREKSRDTWVTVTESAAGTTPKARDEAVAKALRKAVEQGCGVFIKSRSKTKNYQGIYDKVFADAVGYVKKHDTPKCWIEDGMYHARVRALVSTQKFEQNWAAIAHTYHQENNPRVIMVIGESTVKMVNELELDAKSASERTRTATLISQMRRESARAAAAERRTDVDTVRGNFSWWSGRQRPRNWASMTRRDRSRWIENTAAEEIRVAQASRTDSARSRDNFKVWKRVATELKDKGVAQGRLEEFFIDKGIKLIDQSTATALNQRDIMLAAGKDDLVDAAAIGKKFNADVIIIGTAGAEYAGDITVGDVKMHQYSAKLVVRVIRTDSAQLIVSKVFGPITVNSLKKTGGESKALDKLAKKAGPKLLGAVVEAWRKQVNVTRDINLQIENMTYADWKIFETEVEKLRGVKALRLREITKSLANVDVDYEFSTQNFADNLAELKTIKVKITGFSPNRLKLKVVAAKELPAAKPDTKAD